MTPRWRLFTKYLALIVALVSLVLLASSGITLYFSYKENQAQLVALQQEKANSAATRIEQYILNIEEQLGWTALPAAGAGAGLIEQRRFEYLKLLRQVPAITEVSWVNDAGREQLRVSRLAMDVVGSDTDYSQEPRFIQAKGGRTYFSPVYFRKETEPYLTISRLAGGRGGGVTVAEVNLKFVWEVVSQIKIGKAGLAYVVNAEGILIAHPDISLVLQRTDLNRLPHVAALKGAGRSAAGDIERRISREITVAFTDLRGFTAFTETAEPEEVMGVLRDYHDVLGRIVMKHDGTVEHFAGDGVMILFNDPQPVADHELAAVRMTLEMREAVGALAAGWRKRGHELGFGVGIANGYATMGAIGFESRRDYGAIGTVCNLAARLCSEARPGQILISQRVCGKVEQRVRVEPAGELALKGFHRPVAAYNVLGLI